MSGQSSASRHCLKRWFIRQFARGEDFPAVVRNSAELEARVTHKFGDRFGR